MLMKLISPQSMLLGMLIGLPLLGFSATQVPRQTAAPVCFAVPLPKFLHLVNEHFAKAGYVANERSVSSADKRGDTKVEMSFVSQQQYAKAEILIVSLIKSTPRVISLEKHDTKVTLSFAGAVENWPDKEKVTGQIDANLSLMNRLYDELPDKLSTYRKACS